MHIPFWAHSKKGTLYVDYMYSKKVTFCLEHISKMANFVLSTFPFEHIPKGHIPIWAHSKKSTFQKGYIPKKSTFQIKHISFWSHSKKGSVGFEQKEHIPKRAHLKKAHSKRHIQKGTFYFEHIPNHAHSIFITLQKRHIPKGNENKPIRWENLTFKVYHSLPKGLYVNPHHNIWYLCFQSQLKALLSNARALTVAAGAAAAGPR